MKTDHSFQQKRQQWREAVRKDTRLTVAHRLVLTALDEYRNAKTNTAWPTNTTLAEACGLRRQAANMAVNKAASLGYLKAVSRRHGGSDKRGVIEWKFTLPDDQVYAASDTKDQSDVRGDVQGVYATAYRGCTRPRTGGVRDDVHKPPNEPSNEPPNEPTGNTQHIEDLKMQLGLL